MEDALIESKRSQPDKAALQKLLRDRWSVLNLLCNQLLDMDDTEVAHKRTLKGLEAEIAKLRSSKNLLAIENAVNMYMDGIVVKLHQQCHFLKNNDIIFLTLIFAGFSPRSVCFFTDNKLKNFYNKKYRIIQKIEASEVQDKEMFLSYLR